MTWNVRNCARTGLQWSLGLVLIYECSRLLFYSGAVRAAQSAHLPHVLVLAIAAVELAGAILFLIPPTMRAGGKILIGTFLVAAVVHIIHGQPDVGYLLIYGMAVLTIITGGR
jgi:uncharacterized membrane protein YphA (DoxX/SURF4 family)